MFASLLFINLQMIHACFLKNESELKSTFGYYRKIIAYRFDLIVTIFEFKQD